MVWIRGPTIGEGTTATVSLATISGKLIAAKSCPLHLSTPLKHEASILSSLQHSTHIISCHGHSVTTDAYGRKHYNLLLEYVPGGSLSQLCRSRSLSDPTIKSLTRSILEGLRFMHANGYVHCDVKPHNLLLTGQRDAVKIADFGVTKKKLERPRQAICGTPLYISPESVSRGEYEPPSDIWSLGCVVVEMMTGRPAWGMWARTCETCELFRRIGYGDGLPEIPKEASSCEARDFLRRCLVRDPRKRWSAEMLLRHPFVAGEERMAPPTAWPRSHDHVVEFVRDDGCWSTELLSMSCDGDYEIAVSRMMTLLRWRLRRRGRIGLR